MRTGRIKECVKHIKAGSRRASEPQQAELNVVSFVSRAAGNFQAISTELGELTQMMLLNLRSLLNLTLLSPDSRSQSSFIPFRQIFREFGCWMSAALVG